MTRRRRLRDDLRRLGNSPVQLLDPARAQRLERRVLSATGPRELELVEAGSSDPPRPNHRRAAVLTLAAACVLGIIVIASLDRSGSSERILSMSGDVDVVFPDGSVVDGTAGMTVPDGVILRLGRDGEAEVDGMTISGAGDYLVTPDGLTLLPASNPPPTDPPANGPDEEAGAVAEAPVRPDSTEPDPPTTVLRPTTTDRESATTTAVRPTTTERATATTAVQPTTSQRVAPPPPVGSLEPRHYRATDTDDESAGECPSAVALRAVEHRSGTARRDGPAGWTPGRVRVAPDRGCRRLRGRRIAGCRRRRELVATRTGRGAHRAPRGNAAAQRGAADGRRLELPHRRRRGVTAGRWR